MNPALLQSFVDIVGAANVLRKPEDILPYGFDGTAVLKARPGAVVFPGNTSEVAACVSIAATHRIPIVTRGSGTGLSGGSLPIPDCIVLCLVKMDRILELDAPISRCSSRRASPPSDRRCRGSRPVLSARSRLDEDLHHRRQRRRELRRLARAEIRRHAQLRHGPGSRAAGRRGALDRQQVREGRGRLLAEGFVHRLGGHARRHHQSPAEADPQARGQEDAGRHLRADGSGRARPSRTSSPPRSSPARWSSSTAPPSIASRTSPRSACRWIAKPCCSWRPTAIPAAVAEEAAQMEASPARTARVEVRVGARTTPKPRKLATARRSAFSALARVAPTTILEDATVPRSELAKMIRFVAAVAPEAQAAHRHLRPHGRRQPASRPSSPTSATRTRCTASRRRSRRSSTRPSASAAPSPANMASASRKKSFLPKIRGDAQMRVMRELAARSTRTASESRGRCST